MGGVSPNQSPATQNSVTHNYTPLVYNNLAIDDSYFQSETVEAISNHILALYGAKLQAFTRNDPESIIIDLEKVTDTSMVFIHTSAPGQPALTGPGATCERRCVGAGRLLLFLYLPHFHLENRIDDRIDKSTPQEAFRLETYRELAYDQVLFGVVTLTRAKDRLAVFLPRLASNFVVTLYPSANGFPLPQTHPYRTQKTRVFAMVGNITSRIPYPWR